MIRKSFTALFLVLALVYATTVPAQQRTPAVTTQTSTDDILYAQYQAQFEAEFTAYAATHTEAEVQAYFQQRINQMTSEALTFDRTTTQGAAIALDSSAEVMPGDIFIYPDLWDYDDGSSDARLRFCLETRNEECRNNYNAELAQSAITSLAIAAACIGLTAGAGFILCMAGAAAAHALGIEAAKQHYSGCLARAKSDCYLQYGVFKP